jgi:hypothetical protein
MRSSFAKRMTRVKGGGVDIGLDLGRASNGEARGGRGVADAERNLKEKVAELFGYR